MASYDAFMLRVWKRPGDCNRPWVGRLEKLPEGVVWTFDRPQALLGQLRDLLEPAPPAPARPTPCANASPPG